MPLNVRGSGHWLWIATVILVTVNLRPFLTAVGPLSEAIREQLGVSLPMLSALTLLPMALMGAGTWLAPMVLRRLGARRAMALGLMLLGTGCGLRIWGEWVFVLTGSAVLCGAGAALVQGVLPGLIKLFSPHRIALMMAVYSAALMGGGALGAQLSPLAVALGLSWQAALAIWLVPVLPALWLAWIHLRSTDLVTGQDRPANNSMGWLLRRRRTWLLILFFGLLNSGYASMVAWLPLHYQALGWSAAGGGYLVAMLSVAQAVTALVLPVFARHQQDRRPWIWLTLGFQAIGFAALVWFPLAAPTLSSMFLGAGLGGCFAFMMIVALDHLQAPLQAGALNAFMQGGGYLLASLGPWALAQLHLMSGNFVAGWSLHLGLVLVMACMTFLWNPARYPQVMQAPAPGGIG